MLHFSHSLRLVSHISSIQSPNRNQRTKGFKVKQGFKIFTLIVVGIWLLYQLKHSHGKKPYEESSAKMFENLKAGPETKNIGRKGLQPWINKPLELMDDAEENEPQKVKEQNYDKVEEEESDEVEDLIDEEDKEKEEQNEDEDEDGEDMGKQIEDMSSLEDQDQGHDEGEKDAQATSENHNKETGASRVVMSVTKSLGSEFEFGGLRKVKEEVVENSKRVVTEKQKKSMDTTTQAIHVLKW
ncbi:hypothetical protein CR513_46181, partial [Mucuna pruriens]